MFAADAMAQGVLAQDLGRVVHVPVDAVYTVPVAKLASWAGGGDLQVKLEQPVSVDVAGDTRMIKDGDLVAAADLPGDLHVARQQPPDLTELQASLVQAVLDAAALRPAADRGLLAGTSPSPQAGPALSEVLARITSGDAVVETSRPDPGRRGKFAFVPDAEEIMAGITRRSPAYHADVTVEVRNGSGKIGVGEAVVERLASLDVNLPAPLNADSFSYEQTQILAGADTLPVARSIRAILGRGVVLDGADLPKARSESSSATTSGPAIQPEGPAVAALPEPTTSERLARAIVALADGKKAQDIIVLSMDEAVSYTDYFVLLSGANTRQTRGIADEIQQRLRTEHRPARVEGSERASGSCSTTSTWSSTSSPPPLATSTASRRSGATCPGSTSQGRAERPHVERDPQWVQPWGGPPCADWRCAGSRSHWRSRPSCSRFWSPAPSRRWRSTRRPARAPCSASSTTLAPAAACMR